MRITKIVLLVLLVAVVLAQFGGGTQRKVRIAFIPGQTTDPFYISLHHGVQRATDTLGIELLYRGSDEWSVPKQIAILEDVIALAPDVILISPTDQQALIAPLKKAHELGIKVITLDTYIDDGNYRDGSGAGDFPYSHISSDNVYGGRMAARALAESIGKRGTVYVVKGSPASTTEMREYGFKLEMKRYREISILKTLVCNENEKLAASQLQKVYAENPELNGVFGADLFSATGAAAGVQELAKTGKIKVVAIDATEPMIEEIARGRIDSAIAQHPMTIGYFGVMAAYGLITGEGVPLRMDTGFTVINSGNIDDPTIRKHIYVSK